MPNAPSQLFAWAVSHGAHLNNIEIRSTAHGKGLFARFTAPGKPSLSIPNSLVISLDRIAEETDGDTGFWDVINRLPESLPTLDIIRTIFLLYQEYLRRDGRADKWGIYLESLPRETLLPIAWSAEEVALLHEFAVSIAHPVESKISYMRELWSRLVAGGGWFASVTWEDHVLAASWVSSRTFGKKDVEHVLAPVIDMANHSSEPNANWIIDSDGMQLVLLHDVKEGEEICISYDEGRGVAERVYKYGFIEDRDLRGTSKEVSLVTQRGGTFRVREKCIRNGEYDFCMSDDWITLLPRIKGGNARPLPSVAIDETEDFIIVQALHPKKFALKNAEQALSDPLVKHTIRTELRNLVKRGYERILNVRVPHERPGNVRNEVWEMCRIMHSQEKTLLSKAIHALAV